METHQKTFFENFFETFFGSKSQSAENYYESEGGTFTEQKIRSRTVPKKIDCDPLCSPNFLFLLKIKREVKMKYF